MKDGRRDSCLAGLAGKSGGVGAKLSRILAKSFLNEDKPGVRQEQDPKAPKSRLFKAVHRGTVMGLCPKSSPGWESVPWSCR
jgi:hypothetical protein